ncbi:unnamed protein product [Sphagnum troendelagicum]
MAPRAGRAKAHKSKGEKKKKEEKIFPAVLDIVVLLPDDNNNQVILKGITTDRILDVRRLLAAHVETCHLTNISFQHEVRGSRLRDSLEVAGLKPCTLTLQQEDYTEPLAIAHVRRLLDIVACTTFFGPSGKQLEQLEQPVSSSSSELTRSPSSQAISSEVAKSGVVTKATTTERGVFKGKPEAAAAMAAAKEATEKGDMTGMCPPSKLGQFYEFLSFSHLTPPIQFLRCSQKQSPKQEGDLFTFVVKLCNGKLITITACEKGFYSSSRPSIHSHSLVTLLSRLSKAFADAYDELMKGFSERNKFGNLPYGFRANTWVVPPAAAERPSVFPSLPVEDVTWGGDGGGQAGRRDAQSGLIRRPWAHEFSLLAAMPCATSEERQIRDHKAFLLHNMFVDVAVTQASEVIQHVDIRVSQKEPSAGGGNSAATDLHVEKRGNLKFTVHRDIGDASKKLEVKIDASQALGLSPHQLAVKNLLKGVTADESTTVHDSATLGVVIVRHKGYTVLVEAVSSDVDVGELPSEVVVEDQIEGGANALNVNSLRTLLHRSSTNGQAHSSSAAEELEIAEAQIHAVLEESLARLDEEHDTPEALYIRWELGACWVQHLQTQAGGTETEKDGLKKTEKVLEHGSSTVSEKNLSARTGLPTLKPLKKKELDSSLKTSGSQSGKEDSQNPENQSKEDEHTAPVAQPSLMAHLSESTFMRLKDSGTGLHSKTIKELMDGVQQYYTDNALPKLVADFASLELSPVDGRTLTDFMHTRGLQMRSLGQVAKLAAKLPHVQSLCVHEMVVRAFKHVLQAVVASCKNAADLPLNIAAALNVMLGTSLLEEDLEKRLSSSKYLIWRWVETFVNKRFGWKLAGEVISSELRKYAILRGLCHKVGIEIAPHDYDLDTPTPFRTGDIISMIPVYKQVACSSADGRTLLESSKTALDKGKLEDAVTYGTKALAKLVAVCGPYHRMTAGAYSLLAVVLYHTGDFNQATIYQQKALDINERELGLDHPDTMKSYGDLAVFYYRLQHTELALKYVNRALYLLHLICGPSHPNTAATYINIAMMEEGLGNVHIALRYLHEALKCNERLLGADHIQTAASYHAIAIALSLMEAYSLSVQHEQTTLQILQAKLGPDDLRTQDAAAWLEYFDSKAIEQQEAARTGAPKPDPSIASKGHLSVSDLLEYINTEAGEKGKELENKRKPRHLKSKGKGQSQASSTSSSRHSTTDDFAEALTVVVSDEERSASDSSDPLPRRDIWPTVLPEPIVPPSPQESISPIVTSVEAKLGRGKQSVVEITEEEEEEGWQEAVSRSRSFGGGNRRLAHKGATFSGRPQTPSFAGEASSPATLESPANVNKTVSSLALSQAAPDMSTDKIEGGEAAIAGAAVSRAVNHSTHGRMASGSSSTVFGKTAGTFTSGGSAPSYKEVALAPWGSFSRLAVTTDRIQQDSSSTTEQESSFSEKLKQDMTANIEKETTIPVEQLQQEELIPVDKESSELVEGQKNKMLAAKEDSPQLSRVSPDLVISNELDETVSSSADTVESPSDEEIPLPETEIPPSEKPSEVFVDVEARTEMEEVVETEISVQIPSYDHERTGAGVDSEKREEDSSSAEPVVIHEAPVSPSTPDSSSKLLSATAPPFSPTSLGSINQPSAVTSTVTVTALRDRKVLRQSGPPPHLPPASPPPLPQVHRTIAATPFHRPVPHLALFPQPSFLAPYLPGSHFMTPHPGLPIHPLMSPPPPNYFRPPFMMEGPQMPLLGNNPYIGGPPPVFIPLSPSSLSPVQMNPNAAEFIPQFLNPQPMLGIGPPGLPVLIPYAPPAPLVPETFAAPHTTVTEASGSVTEEQAHPAIEVLPREYEQGMHVGTGGAELQLQVDYLHDGTEKGEGEYDFNQHGEELIGPMEAVVGPTEEQELEDENDSESDASEEDDEVDQLSTASVQDEELVPDSSRRLKAGIELQKAWHHGLHNLRTHNLWRHTASRLLTLSNPQ